MSSLNKNIKSVVALLGFFFFVGAVISISLLSNRGNYTYKSSANEISVGTQSIASNTTIDSYITHPPHIQIGTLCVSPIHKALQAPTNRTSSAGSINEVFSSS